MKDFVYDTPVGGENLCNLASDRLKLNDSVDRGEHVVLYGRRNTGKTSLLLHSVIPTFQNKNPKGMAMYSDLMGVQTTQDISRRLRKAFEDATKKSAPLLAAMQKVGAFVKGVRPTFSFDTYGNPEFSLQIDNESGEVDLEDLFQLFAKTAESRSLLLVIDEFQDVALVPQAEALLRAGLQKLPAKVPVIISGSKKHLMSKIFGRPKAPLAGWGYDFQISNIPAEEYWPYVQERLMMSGCKISLATTRFLLELVSMVPEPANIICSAILKGSPQTEITERLISETLDKVAQDRRGRYEEQLLRYSHDEQLLLITIARYQPVAEPQSKDFLRKVSKLSSSGVRKLIGRFENEAVIYREKEGVVIADPIMRRYLTLYH